MYGPILQFFRIPCFLGTLCLWFHVPYTVKISQDTVLHGSLLPGTCFARSPFSEIHIFILYWIVYLVQCFLAIVFPGHNVSGVLCPHSMMFQGLIFPFDLFPRAPCVQGLVFPGLYISRVLFPLVPRAQYFRGSIAPWHGVSMVLCFHSLCFPELHVSRVFQFLVSDSCPALIHFPEKP